MATTNFETWTVDLATIGPIYPMVGSEGILVVIGVIAWLAWHVVQIRTETKNYQEELIRLKDPEILERAFKEGNLD